ncbi:hypothetical protein BDY24DRAFT_419433 [Mrakia frigida]|uniref:uncharacterized protein n=1 Tax=Mrakia frigida TaxID=29902 RepID=UPI003FCC16C5
MSSSSEEDGPNLFVAKRRIRHINTILVHNLTLTPHRDELLSSDVPVSTAGDPDEEGSLSSSTGRRRAGATSVKEAPSPAPGSPTSPSTATNLSFPHPTPSTSGGSPTIRRPSLSRARASSRLSSSYNIPPAFDFDSAASLLAPSPSAPTGLRARSSSRTSIGSTGSDFNQARQAGGLGEVVIREDVEQELSTMEMGSGLDLGVDGSALDAAKRLLESFITLRLSDETAESFRASNEAGPSSSSSSSSTASSSSLALRHVLLAKVITFLLTSNDTLNATSEFSDSPSNTLRDLALLNSPHPTTTSLRIPSSSPKSSPPSPNPERTPFYISPTHRPSTHPRFGDLDPEADFGKWDRRIWREEKVVVEVWVWVAGQKRVKVGKEEEEAVVVEERKEREWKVLKEVEVDLGRVKRWNGKSFLPPNTVLISFTSHPLEFYFVPSPSPAPSSSLVRPRFERTLSDGEIEAPTRSSPILKKKKKLVTEWGDVGDAVERSLRETRMKKGIGFGELHRLVNLQTVLQDTEESSRKIESGLDRLIEEDETAVLLRLIEEEEARIRSVQEDEDALLLETRRIQQRITDLESDLVRRKENLERGDAFLSKERTELEEMERSLELQKSTRAALDPHFHSQRARLSEALEAIFHITPTIHGRSLLFSINNVALPIPTHPKEPAPPLHLPPSELPPNIHVDEDSVATALGYAAMVVQHLAGYLGKHLPYPIISSQSRSLVKDPISVLHGPTRLFPLYSKGVEKYRFEYAVYLLNKDIESLMIDRAIRIMDLRHTLPNLMNLLLTVSSEWPSNLPIEPRSRHVSDETSSILTVAPPVRLDGSEISLDPSDSEDDDDTRGGQTPKASEPSALSIFWGLGGGGKSAAEKKVEETKPRSRRGTIARAFGGAGESKVATPTKEMPSGGGGRGSVVSPATTPGAGS